MFHGNVPSEKEHEATEVHPEIVLMGAPLLVKQIDRWFFRTACYPALDVLLVLIPVPKDESDYCPSSQQHWMKIMVVLRV